MFIRRKAREMDSKQLEKLRRQNQASFDKNIVNIKHTKDSARLDAQHKADHILNQVVCRLDDSIIKATLG
ncbi:hypothetical protein BJ912DRAFT_941001 [Pholiota molesta]|nr:hypothetical protein BJ912DRAFT_941001 [Pholiota molesta]